MTDLLWLAFAESGEGVWTGLPSFAEAVIARSARRMPVLSQLPDGGPVLAMNRYINYHTWSDSRQAGSADGQVESILADKIVLIGSGEITPGLNEKVPTEFFRTQANAVATLVGDEPFKDYTRIEPGLLFLLVAVILAAAFSMLKSLPRFILWIAVVVLFPLASWYCFEALRLILPIGQILFLAAGSFICGTVVFLETGRIESGRNFALALQMQSEEERSRIARDLHDETLPALSRVMRLADQLHDDFPSNPTPAEIRARLEGSVAEMRRIVDDLHPVVLERLGLVPAVKSLCGNFGRDAGIDTQFESLNEMQEPEVEPFTGLCIYRMIQEALNNIEKHSAATKCIISMVRDENKLVISVADNGTGIGTAGVGESSDGLQNIACRPAALLLIFSRTPRTCR